MGGLGATEGSELFVTILLLLLLLPLRLKKQKIDKREIHWV